MPCMFLSGNISTIPPDIPAHYPSLPIPNHPYSPYPYPLTTQLLIYLCISLNIITVTTDYNEKKSLSKYKW